MYKLIDKIILEEKTYIRKPDCEQAVNNRMVWYKNHHCPVKLTIISNIYTLEVK